MSLHFAAGLVLLCSLIGSACTAAALSGSFTSLSVQSEGRTFYYQCSGSRLTVNGDAADEEVFHTLLCHLVSSISGQDVSYTPEGTPLLQVTLSTSEGMHKITYYKDDSDSSLVYVCVTGSSDEESMTTDAWRIGTILLACEGSRIQEAQNPPSLEPQSSPEPVPASQP